MVDDNVVLCPDLNSLTVERKCFYCGRKDVRNRIICGKCVRDGLEIVKRYYDKTLKFEDIGKIIEGK